MEKMNLKTTINQIGEYYGFSNREAREELDCALSEAGVNLQDLKPRSFALIKLKEDSTDYVIEIKFSV